MIVFCQYVNVNILCLLPFPSNTLQKRMFYLKIYILKELRIVSFKGMS